MLRDVVYTETGDARWLFHRRALQILEAEEGPAVVLTHHSLAAGQMRDAFLHSLVVGREVLRLSAMSEATVHFDCTLHFVRECVAT